jgi:tRNA-splicing endonuclease subunit Sen15
MDTHPSVKVLADQLGTYPHTAGALLQTYNDISLAQRWKSVHTHALPQCQRFAVIGDRPYTGAGGQTLWEHTSVVPCTLAEVLSASWLRNVFTELPEGAEAFYLAITSEDSSVVYYKISRGIVKPAL